MTAFSHAELDSASTLKLPYTQNNWILTLWNLNQVWGD